MSGQSSKPHPLKDKWFVMYFQFVRQKKKMKEYEDQQKPVELDWVTTAEELYATTNAFPFTHLPTDDNVVFARNKVSPYYEDFPDGTRISVFTRTKPQGEQAIALVLAAVMGEHLQTVTNGDSTADVVSITHKPSNIYPEALRVEVWLRNSDHRDGFEKYFNALMKPHPGIKVICRPISGDPAGEQA